MPFSDRIQAGRKLGEALKGYKGADVVVLGIPRGGAIVAAEVARALDAPMDLVITRKIEAPGEPEYALGAVTQDGEVILDKQAAEAMGATQEYLETQVRQKQGEVKERIRRFREDAPPTGLKGRVVIIVDDGIATGSSVGAAIMSVKKGEPRSIVVAVPVAPRDAVESLSSEDVKVVSLETPVEFLAIGEFYSDFQQVEDGEVRRVLLENWSRRKKGQGI